MKIGILLPIFSLPSAYGIGDFGKETREFIDILSENKIDYWEILPIHACEISPYSPSSYYALNENFLSLDQLQALGLIKKAAPRPKKSRIHYDNYKETYFEEAYRSFQPSLEFLEFSKKVEIQEYAKYRSEKTGKEENYYLFLQYLLEKEWQDLLAYAHQKNVQIIGDLPIYPDFDSAEIKFHSSYYELENRQRKYVSGASPDYFNEEGQKWGHPLYDFHRMKVDHYSYLLKRYQEFLNRFDKIRIDHFRAFDTYYKIPIEKSAKEGFYVEGPGKDFFDQLFTFTTPDRFLVEDLGDIRKETEQLRDYYHFCKMKIMQYTIDCKEEKDTYEDTENMVIYTGNHDNHTIVGWYQNLSKEEQIGLRRFLQEQDCREEEIHLACIHYCLKSKAKYAIFPVQDIMGLEDDARINLPGEEVEANWSWKLLDFEEFRKSMKVFQELRNLERR